MQNSTQIQVWELLLQVLLITRTMLAHVAHVVPSFELHVAQTHSVPVRKLLARRWALVLGQGLCKKKETKSTWTREHNELSPHTLKHNERICKQNTLHHHLGPPATSLQKLGLGLPLPRLRIDARSVPHKPLIEAHVMLSGDDAPPGAGHDWVQAIALSAFYCCPSDVDQVFLPAVWRTLHGDR